MVQRLVVVEKIVSVMNNQEKALIYDECLRDSDKLQREISKLKSEYSPNIPSHIQKIINENNVKINKLVLKLENLFR